MDGMAILKDVLTSELRKAFPDMPIEFSEPGSKLIATVPPKHSSWKPIVIRDDGHEVTIVYGDLTHCHHKCYQCDASDEQKAYVIAEDVIGELKMVFDDKVEFYNLGSSSGMGPVDHAEGRSMSARGFQTILWSGRNLP